MAALPLIPLLMLLGGERRPRRPMLFAFGLAPLPLLWIARNWALWGAVLITPNSGTHLYDYLRTMLRQSQGLSVVERHPLTHDPVDLRLPTTPEEWRSQFGFDFENLGKRSVLLGRLATEEIAADPAGYVKLTAKKQPWLYFGTGVQALYTMSFPDLASARAAVERPDWLWRSGWWAYLATAELLLALGYALAAVGLWKGARDPRLRGAVLVCVVMLVVQAVVVGPFGHTRYRFLMTPFFGVLAAVGLAKLRSRQDEVVAVDNLLPPRSGKELRKLPSRATHDAAGFVGGVVRQSAGELDPLRLLHGDDIS
jgi:hypothetical protein